MLAEQKDTSIVITGSKSEESLCKEFEVSSSVINFSGHVKSFIIKGTYQVKQNYLFQTQPDQCTLLQLWEFT